MSALRSSSSAECFLPLSPLMLVFFLFPSMGVWAMRTKLNYFIQPLYQSQNAKPSTDSPKTNSSNTRKTIAYKQAQALKEKLQNQIMEIVKKY